ncbi:MAG TPA: isoprenylcysteine carboxylmethyltransferase family protein [Hyphomicrobiaceae bacterium]|nr:isoprenylcysteine carboxylmethyltransferase family protein [Hyphomicrobiaceae bacterium]
MAHHDDGDRPNRHHWPPILYVAVIVGAWLAERYLSPAPLLSRTPGQAIGWPLFAIGIALGAAALWGFYRIGTSFDPTAPARALATGGLYRFSRNPMYLGAILAFTGFGLAWPAASLVWLMPLLAFGLIKLAIEPEEAYLERRFGSAYVDYKSEVRRWL